MKKSFFLLSVILLLGVFLIPSNSVNAQGGLVPCGPEFPPPDDMCQFCHIFVLLNNIIGFIAKLVPLVAVLMLVIGGVWYFFAGVSEEAKRKGKAIVTSSVIGVAIILCAWIAVTIIFQVAGVIEMEAGWKWYEIKCST